MINPTDQQILDEIVSGNQKAFDELYRREYKRLFMFSLKYIHDQTMAEEVVHDVFIKIWNQTSSLIIQQSLSSYLTKAVFNLKNFLTLTSGIE
ncbi:hypothetical protein I5M32_09475 [Pedobacter sp. SD-b]|uniref:RNA polymerase sigma-70 region 2 domain-containing protein n=1 Tax=Pedobacter segetis TaxID=2793069 RepID=A0ABS1BK84_9SPHI|nr:sigma factor [Pedobacter segetis]MBK0383187.1 hypothetical protein [Pedobacter segetis]